MTKLLCGDRNNISDRRLQGAPAAGVA